MLSFVCVAESELLAPVATSEMDDLEWQEYDRLVSIVKHDLESLQFNIYHTWMKQLKTRLHKMIIPAIIESQSLPGFITNDGNRFLNKLLQSSSGPQFSMDDLINLLNKVYKAMKAYYLEESIIQQAAQALLKLVGVTAFNDLLMRCVLLYILSNWQAKFPVLETWITDQLQHHEDRRMVQEPRYAGRDASTGTSSAGNEASPIEEGNNCGYRDHFRHLLDAYTHPNPETHQCNLVF